MHHFIHIGYPKCFSTTLQRNLFSQHPQIHYGGIGLQSNIDFVSDDLNLIFESGITYFRNTLFEKNFMNFKNSVNNFSIEAAKFPEKKIAGFSSEHLLFNFSPQGVDYTLKLERLKMLFENRELDIILLLREQFSLILSLYKESVRLGYPFTLREYIDWIYRYQDRNFFSELLYHEVVEILYELFGRDHVFIFFYEEYSQRNHSKEKTIKDLFEELTKKLHIDRIDFQININNPTLTDNDLANKLSINQKIKHDYGSYHLNGFEDHRRRVFFTKYLKLDLKEEELFENVIRKREGLNLSKKMEVPDKDEIKKIYSCNKTAYERMRMIFDESNHMLSYKIETDFKKLFEQSRNTFEKSVFID